MIELLLLDRKPEILAARLASLEGRVRLHLASSSEQAMAVAGKVEVAIVMPQLVQRELVAAMGKLQWIQTLSAGVDPLLPLGIPASVKVTSAAGVHAPQMCELIFFQLLTLLRNSREVLRRQDAHEWKPGPQPLLWGKRLLIVGVGKIGVALAKRAQAFGLHVTGASGGRREADGFDAIRPMEALHAALGEADFVVVLTPYSEKTHHLFGEAAFAAMRPGALFVNAGRGKVVKQEALIAALQAGQIGGAALDVFETEPLPTDSPLWDLPGLLITPHVGGYSDIFTDQVAPFLLANFANWEAGRPLENLVRLQS